MNKLSLAVVTAVAALAAQPVSAHSPGKASDGYVADSSGMVVTDASGDCVRTSSWTRDMATSKCDADLLPRMAAVTPEPAPAPAPATKAVPTVEKLTLREETLFDTGKAELRPNGRSELDALAEKMKDKNISIEQIVVTGHASAPGTNNFNQLLSERRAQTVKTYLAERGVDASKIFTQGMGETKPIASNDTAEGRAQNRRVEIEIKAQRTTMSSN